MTITHGVRFPEGYVPRRECPGCGRTYDPANGHICGRGDDPFGIREPAVSSGEGDPKEEAP
jgi:hypothetical protein